MDKPKLIFKYRALSNQEDINRFQDIIKNHRLYLPTVYQLNDPFEGKIDISPGIMGDFIRRAMDIDLYPTRIVKHNTRVLALSEDCFSPLLWAYYCNDYHGACLCYKTDKSFSTINPVKYSESIEVGNGEIVNGYKRVLELIKDSLFIKQKDWEYEREWRMIFQQDEDDLVFEEERIEGKFFHYEPNELVGVILGDNLDRSIKERIREIVPDSIKVFEVHTGALSGKVKLFEYGYVYPGDGSDPDYICTIEELLARTDS